MRYLTFTILALPGLLVTHWLLERYALTPDDTGLLSASATLLALSFALLLGVVPFHTWVTGIGGDSVPLAGTFVLTVGNGAVWFLLLDFLETYPWLSSHPRFESLIFAPGLAMVVMGGLLAPAQRRLGLLMGYAALVDSGAALIALSMSSRLGLALVILSLLIRPVGLNIMSAGLSGLRARNGGADDFDALRGLGWQARWSTAALVFGGLSAAGLPVSAGFIYRWALCRALAGVGVMVGVGRALSALVVRPRSSEDRSVVSSVSPEGRLTAVVVVVAIMACVGVGLFPQVLAPLAVRLTEAYTFFTP